MIKYSISRKRELSLLFLGFLTLFIILSCSSCNTSKTSQLSKDTIKHFPKKHFEPLAPGTAKIEGTLTSFQDKDGETLCKILVMKVMGYGPTTPAIAVNSNLLVSLTKEKIHGLKIPLKELQKSGKIIKLKIINRKAPVNSNNSVEIWKAIKINLDLLN